MSKNWRTATKAYIKQDVGRVFFFKPISSPRRNGKLKAIQKIASELDLFLDSPNGAAAVELLCASKKTILFGEYKTGSGYNCLYHEYFLNGTGLYLAVSGLPYTHSVPTESKTEIRSITSEEAVSMYSRYTPSNIAGFMSWLRAELDKIAAAAPQVES